MVKQHYNKLTGWIDRKRHSLLLLATVLVLILPAFSGIGFLSEILFVVSLSFLFIQSMVVATTFRKRNIFLRYAGVVLMILIIWLQPAGFNTRAIDIGKLILIVIFFVFIIISLVRFIFRAKEVNLTVITTAINIYLIMGIIAGSLAFLFYELYPDAYNFPDNIQVPRFVNFIYFSFITMATVGYGDITPACQETQTLAFTMAVTGQLYVAIIIAILVGKYLVHADNKNSGKTVPD